MRNFAYICLLGTTLAVTLSSCDVDTGLDEAGVECSVNEIIAEDAAEAIDDEKSGEEDSQEIDEDLAIFNALHEHFGIDDMVEEDMHERAHGR